MRAIIAVLALAGVAIGGLTAVRAQTTQQKQAQSPEEMQKIMNATMGAMIPMMGKMTEAMLEAQLVFAERQGTALRLATFKRNLYEALLKKGFTSEQAMQITIATPPPAAALSSK